MLCSILNLHFPGSVWHINAQEITVEGRKSGMNGGRERGQEERRETREKGRKFLPRTVRKHPSWPLLSADFMNYNCKEDPPCS